MFPVNVYNILINNISLYKYYIYFIFFFVYIIIPFILSYKVKNNNVCN